MFCMRGHDLHNPMDILEANVETRFCMPAIIFAQNFWFSWVFVQKNSQWTVKRSLTLSCHHKKYYSRMNGAMIMRWLQIHRTPLYPKIQSLSGRQAFVKHDTWSLMQRSKRATRWSKFYLTDKQMLYAAMDALMTAETFRALNPVTTLDRNVSRWKWTIYHASQIASFKASQALTCLPVRAQKRRDRFTQAQLAILSTAMWREIVGSSVLDI